MPSGNPFNDNGNPVWMLWTGIIQLLLYSLPAIWSVFLFLRHERRVALRSARARPGAEFQTEEAAGSPPTREEPGRAA